MQNTMKWICLLFWMYVPLSHAHKLNDSFLAVEANENELNIRWDLPAPTLGRLLKLENESPLSNEQWEPYHQNIIQYATQKLTLMMGTERCNIVDFSPVGISQLSGGTYVTYNVLAKCPTASESLKVDYQLLFEVDDLHKSYVSLVQGGTTQTAIIDATQRVHTLSFVKVDRLSQFLSFVWEGIWHIWIGADHILFLLTLLLAAVLFRENGQWKAYSQFSDACWETFRVVTAFTVAHSITLILASMQWVALPSRLVESAIAFSVFIAALNNIRPFIKGKRWSIAFVFGLIHGFGFANVLGDLGLPKQALISALLGFNLGVEFGQLAIVAGALPLLFVARQMATYQTLILRGGSAITLVVSILWMVDRIGDLGFMPF